MLQITYTEGELKLLEAADIAEQNEGYEQQRYAKECGSPACMLGGYAFAHPDRWKFARVYQSGWPHLVPHLVSKPAPGRDFHDWRPGNTLLDSMMEEFGITIEEAHEIFDGDGCDGAYRNGKKAAAWLRNWVRERAEARVKA